MIATSPRPTSAARAPRLALLLALALSASCQSDSKRQRIGQMAKLAQQVDRLRQADNADKRALLAALVATDCKDGAACALKDLCVRAYELHQRALDSIEALKLAAHSDAAVVPDAARRLESTQHDLERARGLMEQCAEEQVRAMRKSLM